MRVVRTAAEPQQVSARQSPGAPPQFEPLFARAHKRALGVAVGLTAGVAIFLLTALHVVLRIEGLRIGLLGQYFYGYEVTWFGAFVGLAWGFFTGFIAGWMLGFIHNFTVSLWMFVVRTRNDLKRTQNFLDHI
jgi:hypothetical protein